MGKEIIVNDSNFEQTVLRAQAPVLVDFWAPWCRPCLMAAPVLEKLAEEYSGRVTIAKLNVDENPTVASQYQVMSIPTMIIFKEGKPLSNIIGFQPKEQLMKHLDAALE